MEGRWTERRGAGERGTLSYLTCTLEYYGVQVGGSETVLAVFNVLSSCLCQEHSAWS